MRCPKCITENRRSTIRQVEVPQTHLPADKYYDEEGLAHSHDPNPTVIRYTCSNGHTWTVKSFTSCPSCNRVDALKGPL